MSERAEVAVGEAVVEKRKVSWGAIFGGTVVALGIWAMLYAFGLAIGLTSISPEAVRGPALFTGIWSVISPLIALFIGGWVSARLAGSFDRTAGALHGAVLWGLTVLLGGFALTSAVGAAASGAASFGKAAVSSVSGAVQGGGASQVGQALGINTNDLLAPVNRKLQQEGKPPITADQLSAAVQSAVGTSIRQGKLDVNTFENSLAQNTNLSRQDSREIAQTLEARVNQSLAQARESAAEAAVAVGKAMWGVFFALLLGLVSSVLGAIAGAAGGRKKERRALEQARKPAEAR